MLHLAFHVSPSDTLQNVGTYCSVLVDETQLTTASFEELNE